MPFDPPLGPLLDRLHAQSDAQGEAIGSYFAERAREGSLDWREFDERTHRFMSDKLVALDQRPALERVAPSLRRGAIVIADNTRAFREAYRDYFDFVSDPANRLRTLTLPFEGGLELTVRD